MARANPWIRFATPSAFTLLSIDETFWDLHVAESRRKADELKAKTSEEATIGHQPTLTDHLQIFLLVTIAVVGGSSRMKGPKYVVIKMGVNNAKKT
jgi:hypothetical protein